MRRSRQTCSTSALGPVLAPLLGPALALVTVALAGCSGDPALPRPAPPAPPDKTIPYDTLSEYGFFEGPLLDMKPRAGVVPYDVASPLWADHAGKGRFIALPKGSSIAFGELEGWQFPLGAIVIKSFFVSMDLRAPTGPARILETRLLIRQEEGWTAHTYLWNDEQTEARRVIAGERIEIVYTDADGKPAQEQYLVPNTNQCKSCHERDDETELLGVITPQLNRDVPTPAGPPRNQLEWLAEQGLFRDPLPPREALPAFADPRGDAPLDDRARAYLHGNCSHCHRPGAGGGPSGLVLLAWEDNPKKRGICKAPVAAGAGTGGHSHDIVPGSPGESIMIFRMSSTDPEIKMPELPSRIPDQEGVALVSAWISAMDPPGCAP
jgi:uncharacterized repeat protein (TIGR03806 family)